MNVLAFLASMLDSKSGGAPGAASRTVEGGTQTAFADILQGQTDSDGGPVGGTGAGNGDLLQPGIGPGGGNRRPTGPVDGDNVLPFGGEGPFSGAWGLEQPVSLLQAVRDGLESGTMSLDALEQAFEEFKGQDQSGGFPTGAGGDPQAPTLPPPSFAPTVFGGGGTTENGGITGSPDGQGPTSQPGLPGTGQVLTPGIDGDLAQGLPQGPVQTLEPVIAGSPGQGGDNPTNPTPGTQGPATGDVPGTHPSALGLDGDLRYPTGTPANGDASTLASGLQAGAGTVPDPTGPNADAQAQFTGTGSGSPESGTGGLPPVDGDLAAAPRPGGAVPPVEAGRGSTNPLPQGTLQRDAHVVGQVAPLQDTNIDDGLPVQDELYRSVNKGQPDGAGQSGNAESGLPGTRNASPPDAAVLANNGRSGPVSDFIPVSTKPAQDAGETNPAYRSPPAWVDALRSAQIRGPEPGQSPAQPATGLLSDQDGAAPLSSAKPDTALSGLSAPGATNRANAEGLADGSNPATDGDTGRQPAAGNGLLTATGDKGAGQAGTAPDRIALAQVAESGNPVLPQDVDAPLDLPEEPLLNLGSVRPDNNPAVQRPVTGGQSNGYSTVPMEAVGIHIAKMAQQKESSFEIRLHPAELGRIDVRLDIGEQGEVRAHLTVERRETMDMLARDARELQKALNEAGLTADNNSLNFSMKNQNGDGFGEGRQDGERAGQAGRTEDDPGPDLSEAAARGAYVRSSDGVLDISI